MLILTSKVKFTSDLLVTPHGKYKWRLIEPLRTNYETIEVPEGFVTDLASIPRVLWSIYPPMGNYTEAAVLHDWLCVTKPFDQAIVDEIFYHQMKDAGVPKYKAWLFYRAVRLNSIIKGK